MSTIYDYPVVLNDYKTNFVKYNDELCFMSVRELIVIAKLKEEYTLIETVVDYIVLQHPEIQNGNVTKTLSFREYLNNIESYSYWKGHGSWEDWGKANVNFDVMAFPDNLDIYHDNIWNERCILATGRYELSDDLKYDKFLITLEEYYKLIDIDTWYGTDKILLEDVVDDVVWYNVCYKNMYDTASHEHPYTIYLSNKIKDYMKPSHYGKLYKLDVAYDKYINIGKELVFYYSSRDSIKYFCKEAIDNLATLDRSILTRVKESLASIKQASEQLKDYYDVWR